MYTYWGHSGLTNRYALGIFTIPNDISKVTLGDISKEDKTAGLFKNLTLQIFVGPCVISKVTLRYFSNVDSNSWAL